MSPTLVQTDRPHATKQKPLDLARKVLNIESHEIAEAAKRLDTTFEEAVKLILECKGRVVVTGIGKSGHIGNKIAATLASTGTPAFFMHTAEASHGDLGMITANDVVLALSNSGESDEILNILPTIKRLGAKVIGITGKSNSTLEKESDCHLSAAVSQEACPLGLSPTASTTTALALGDALAVCVLDCRDFSAEDFARSHPGGTIGRRLLTRVKHIMRTDNAVPSVNEETTLSEVLNEITEKNLGLTAVVSEKSDVTGIFTDGDLRRLFVKGADANTTKIKDVMHPSPITIQADQLAVEALELMEKNEIHGLLVTDDANKLIGAFNMHDLLMAKII